MGIENKRIYIHVGMPKTGSTYLQGRVFPKLKGIHYIPTVRYKSTQKIVESTDYDNYLTSREFDQQMEREVSKFAKVFPDATPIIVLRKHSSYIASQYRRFVKNGFHLTFTQFIDIKSDQGYFKKRDLDFFWHIQLLEKHFSQRPIVLFYDDLRKNPEAFIQNFAKVTHSEVDLNDVDLSRKHASYSEKQLKAIYKVSGVLPVQNKNLVKFKPLNSLLKIPVKAIRYSTLHISKYLPSKDNSPFIDPAELAAIDDFCAEDWRKCLEYAGR